MRHGESEAFCTLRVWWKDEPASSYDTKENFLPQETKNSFSKVLNYIFTFISQ